MNGLSDKRDLPITPSTAPPPHRSRWFKGHALLWSLLGLALLLLLGSLVWGYRCRDILWIDLCHYYYVLTDKEKIQAFLKAAGPLGPLLFIVTQALQVVLAPIPGEATGFIGGFLFGVAPGLVYSTIGLTVGSILAFLLGRWLEEHFVARVVRPETLKKFDFLIERQGTLIAFFLFLLPGFPKDYLCFILGLSNMSLRLFVVMVTVGRLPGTLMLTLQGAQVYKGNYYVTFILFGLCLALGGVMYWYRETLYQWLKRWDHPEEKDR